MLFPEDLHRKPVHIMDYLRHVVKGIHLPLDSQQRTGQPEEALRPEAQ